MASVSKKPSGSWVCQYYEGDKRLSINLGKMSNADADRINELVESLLTRRKLGKEPSAQAMESLAKMPAIWRKLAAKGLCEGPADQPTLEEWLERFSDSQRDLKDGTRTSYKQTMECLKLHFGKDRKLHRITEPDAEGFRVWLRAEGNRRDTAVPGLAEATVARRIKHARTIFRRAERAGLIPLNPFRDVRAGKMSNSQRQHFVERATIEKILTHADDEWKLIIALSRYGAVRCPSDTLSLKWSDINLERREIVIHGKNGKRRVVPIFPELAPFLQAGGTGYVIKSYRGTEANLRTQFRRLIRRAEENPWPRTFHNLRASRGTELLREGYPMHEVAKWMGNTPAVLLEHYAMTTDETFRRAAGLEENTVAEKTAVPMRNRTPQGVRTKGMALNEALQTLVDAGFMQPDAVRCIEVALAKMTPTGLEPVLPP